MVGNLDDVFRMLSDGVHWTDILRFLLCLSSFLCMYLYLPLFICSKSLRSFISLPNPRFLSHFSIPYFLNHFLAPFTFSYFPLSLSHMYIPTSPPALLVQSPIHTPIHPPSYHKLPSHLLLKPSDRANRTLREHIQPPRPSERRVGVSMSED